MRPGTEYKFGNRWKDVLKGGWKSRMKLLAVLACAAVLASGCSAETAGTEKQKQTLAIDYVGEDGKVVTEAVAQEGGGAAGQPQESSSGGAGNAPKQDDKQASGGEGDTVQLQKAGATPSSSVGNQQQPAGAGGTGDGTGTGGNGNPGGSAGGGTGGSGGNGNAGGGNGSPGGGSAGNGTGSPGGTQPAQPSSGNTVTLTIRCDTAVANGLHKESKWAGIVPASGCILPVTTLEFDEGQTVFDLMCKIRDTYKLQMEYSGSGVSAYIRGINNLYEKDAGRWSGWMYRVNGWYPNYGSGQYPVKNGDVIEWNYTCDGGADLGHSMLE